MLNIFFYYYSQDIHNLYVIKKSIVSECDESNVDWNARERSHSLATLLSENLVYFIITYKITAPASFKAAGRVFEYDYCS